MYPVLRFILFLFTLGIVGVIGIGGFLAAHKAAQNDEGGKVAWGFAAVFEGLAFLMLVGNGMRWENFAIAAVILGQVVYFLVARRRVGPAR